MSKKKSQLSLLPHRKKNLQEKARRLGDLDRHIADLKEIYWDDLIGFARALLQETQLAAHVAVVEAVDTERGFAIEFSYLSRAAGRIHHV